jgi:hypothetical protein
MRAEPARVSPVRSTAATSGHSSGQHRSSENPRVENSYIDGQSMLPTYHRGASTDGQRGLERQLQPGHQRQQERNPPVLGNSANRCPAIGRGRCR